MGPVVDPASAMTPGRALFEREPPHFKPSKHKERDLLWVHLSPEARARYEERARADA